MRAETQNTVAEIEKSLELLAQRLNWETAEYRLEEFNARVEDPNLWDDAEAARLGKERAFTPGAEQAFPAMSRGPWPLRPEFLAG